MSDTGWFAVMLVGISFAMALGLIFVKNDYQACVWAGHSPVECRKAQEID